MLDNPILIAAVIVALILVLLAIFTVFTYLFLKVAVELRRIEKRIK